MFGVLAVAGGNYIRLYKNGSSYKTAGYIDNTFSAGMNLKVSVKLLAGEYVDLRPAAALTFGGGVLNAGTSNLTVKRTGNY